MTGRVSDVWVGESKQMRGGNEMRRGLDAIKRTGKWRKGLREMVETDEREEMDS